MTQDASFGDRGDRQPLGEDVAYVVRHEERLNVEKAWRGAGLLRARKLVDTAEVEAVLPRDVETVEVVREEAYADDSGKIETLPDGSISIPVFEEEIVVSKRIVLKERVIVRKETITERKRFDFDVRKERVEIETDPGLEITDETRA